MPTISVIIPIYNGARYLRECLDAVCRQTLTDIEIICVDDGSTDNSPAIAAEYAARDGRVRVYSLGENRGAAAARNYGMRQATGEYLGFVDCDDYPCLDFYEKLLAGAEGGKFDVVKGNYRYWGIDGKSLPVDYSMNEGIKKHKTNFSYAFASAIYRRELLNSNAIVFPEDRTDIEDPLFALRVALSCHSIGIVESAEINIRINRHSATFKPPTIKGIQHKFDGLRNIIMMLNRHKELSPESYGFTVAFWFKSVIFNSLKNTNADTFITILDNLWFVFIELEHLDACETAFVNFQLGELFSALKVSSVNGAARWLKQFYHDKSFAAQSLRIRKAGALVANRACVAIPIYKADLAADERAALMQCFRVLGAHPIRFFGPQSLDRTVHEQLANEHGIPFAFVPFPDVFFRSTVHYSRLLLRPEFYSQFAAYEYMLICQLDAWVFRDELAWWCDQGYDYIGAPWFEGYADAPPDAAFIVGGNGGFSLRNVHTLMRGTDALIRMYADKPDGAVCFNTAEDGVICARMPLLDAAFTIAPSEVEAHFAWEVHPEILCSMTGCLPFGAHAVAVYSPEFWKHHIVKPE